MHKKESGLLTALKTVLTEPMVLLLIAAAAVYFAIGEAGDAIFLGGAVVLVAGIALYQDSRSRSALQALQSYTRPLAKVIRDREVVEVHSDELVVGDCMVVEEGMPVAADGILIHANDFTVDESILTGESESIGKQPDGDDPLIYRGTTATGGMAVAQVSKVGNATRIGQIGASLDDIKPEKTPLEKQIAHFVKWMVVVGVVVFALVWGLNYLRHGSVLESLLQALTLAMSILPEEIPVAFTTFMALGAWRLMKNGVVVKQMKTVETLGSATVICTDKTGTITQNAMEFKAIYLPGAQAPQGLSMLNAPVSEKPNDAEALLLRTAMWASEPMPFDPMEVALHRAYADGAARDERPDYTMVHEYPLGGRPPMMTHIFENETGDRIIACKGAPEALIAHSRLDPLQKEQVRQAAESMAKEGYRLLGVGLVADAQGPFPSAQTEFCFEFLGLVAFEDPPKPDMDKVLRDFYQAGIEVKLITGDNELTAKAIAKKIGMHGSGHHLDGATLMEMSDTELQDAVKQTHLYTRMFPEAKLRIINALKANGEVVAMTGDGVNDGPALKAAHIGVAMGKRGAELAKQAASLILTDDDLSKMVDAVAAGRKIYDNLKKAIGYIIAIHIPIIMVVFVPLALGWIYPNIFSPVHVIFLELIMGPTCSIIYESEPMEKGTMQRPPRPFSTTFFEAGEVLENIIKGGAIALAALTVYRYAVGIGMDEQATRTLVFTTLIAANMALTLVSRSPVESLITSLGYKNRLIPVILLASGVGTAALIFVPPFAAFFGFAPLGGTELGVAAVAGVASAVWFEFPKWLRRRSLHKQLTAAMP